MHLFLSPHFDDAVFSCGATIHKLTSAGEKVVILTVMGGSPEAGRIPDTPLIRELHARWGEGSDPVRARLQEDENAARTLGAESQHLTVWMDCIYRLSRGGQPLYPTVEAIFGDISPDDPALKLLPTVVLPQAATASAVYAPMGAGAHVDHCIVRDWALELKNQNPGLALRFYEEYPYTQDRSVVERASVYFSQHQPPIALQSETVTFDESSVAAKLRAMACYTSQLSSFWESIVKMELSARTTMNETGAGKPAERFWNTQIR